MNRQGTRKNLVAAHPGNRNAVKHGAYSAHVKAPRVAELVEELVAEHPHEPPANLRALAELYVTAERLSGWVAEREDGTKPAAQLAMGPIWWTSDVEEWIRKTPIRRGRPRRQH